MLQPQEMNPRWIVLSFGLGVVACAVGAALIFDAHRHVRLAEPSLETLLLGLEFLMLACVAGLLGFLCIQVARGPSRVAPKVIRGDEGGILLASVLTVALFDVIAVQMFIQLRDGEASSYFLPVAFAIGGAVVKLSVVSQLWSLVTRGRSCVILDDGPLVVGDAVRGVFEVPFAVARAPHLRATLSLQRLDVLSSDIESSPSETALWSESMELRTWSRVSRRRARAPFRFDPPAHLRSGMRVSAGLHTWRLSVESLSVRRAFAWNCLIPLATDDSVAERIMAPPETASVPFGR